MSRYINPYTEFGFRRLFGEEANNDVLIDFLKTFLPEKHRVKTLNFRNTGQLDQIAMDHKAVIDIFCEAENGEKFIVELQKAKQQFFKDRAIFCTAFPIREQVENGEGWCYELQAIYLIDVLDFEYDEKEESRKFLRDVTFKDQDGDLFYDRLHLFFLQMPFFKKTESELETHKDKWCYFLKNLADFDGIPGILRESVFEQAFETAEIARLNKQEYQQYEADRRAYWDSNVAFCTAQQEGLEKGVEIGVEIGMEKGMEIGKTEEKTEIARNMKRKCLDTALISEITGLSPEEIEQLD